MQPAVTYWVVIRYDQDKKPGVGDCPGEVFSGVTSIRIIGSAVVLDTPDGVVSRSNVDMVISEQEMD